MFYIEAHEDWAKLREPYCCSWIDIMLSPSYARAFLYLVPARLYCKFLSLFLKGERFGPKRTRIQVWEKKGIENHGISCSGARWSTWMLPNAAKPFWATAIQKDAVAAHQLSYCILGRTFRGIKVKEVEKHQPSLLHQYMVFRYFCTSKK